MLLALLTILGFAVGFGLSWIRFRRRLESEVADRLRDRFTEEVGRELDRRREASRPRA